MSRSKTHRAWAINLRLRGHPSPCLMGILWPEDREPAPHLRGCRTALYQTRREAQEYLRAKKAAEGHRADGIYYWRRAGVCRVTVAVTPHDGPA